PELLARVRAQLRRAGTVSNGGAASPVAKFGSVTINLATHEVARAGIPVHLTPNEFRLLTALVRGHGKVLTHRQLLMEVWGPGYSERAH
ncbi:DNA-binding response regulator, partial [Escherichia coli]|nr:DNA-binding response regulator [Escherichia coli]